VYSCTVCRSGSASRARRVPRSRYPAPRAHPGGALSRETISMVRSGSRPASSGSRPLVPIGRRAQRYTTMSGTEAGIAFG
jgi:hypothetical protein